MTDAGIRKFHCCAAPAALPRAHAAPASHDVADSAAISLGVTARECL